MTSCLLKKSCCMNATRLAMSGVNYSCPDASMFELESWTTMFSPPNEEAWRADTCPIPSPTSTTFPAGGVQSSMKLAGWSETIEAAQIVRFIPF